jgi:hypothetical protein
MARTPEQRAADAQLEAAVAAASKALGFPPDDGFTITEFVVAVEAVKFNPDDDSEFEEYHHVLYQGGTTRSTVALGLLGLAMRMVEDGVTASYGTAESDTTDL